MFLKRCIISCLLAAACSGSLSAQKSYTLDASDLPLSQATNIAMQGLNPEGVSLGVNNKYFTRNHKPWYPLMGELHFNRVPPAEWEAGILKMKNAGIGIIATYIFWNEHEVSPGVWDWSGNRNLAEFVRLCQLHGMYVWLRIGPWSHGEQLYGGFPKWIEEMPRTRTNDPAYLAKVKFIYDAIGNQTRGLFFKDGGPIIGTQLENEYASGQPEHISTLKQLAIAAGIQPVYWSVTANTVFEDKKMEVIPLQGAYAYRGWERAGGKPTVDFLYGDDQWIMAGTLGKVFYNPELFPRGMCEQGAGSQMMWGNRFVVDPEVIAAHVQNQVGRGMNLMGYYMFHGGTQTPGLEEPGLPLNYDFQAPIGEYGILSKSYYTLHTIHSFLNDFGEEIALTQPVSPANPVRDIYDTTQLRYIARVGAHNNGFLFLCNIQRGVVMRDKEVQVSVQLKNDTIHFPALALKGQTYPILPFNLQAGSVLIRYATAQPFAKIVNGKHTTIFFQQLPGVAPAVSVRTATVRHAAVKQAVRDLLLKPGNRQTIDITGVNNDTVTLVFMDKEAASHSWHTTLQGRQVLLQTKADLLASDQQLELRQVNDTSFRLKVYPADAATLLPGAGKWRKDGAFAVADFTVPRILPVVKIDKTTVEVGDTMPASLADILLRVVYNGNAATLFVNGKPVSDNLQNGQPWYVGLKRFAGEKLQLQLQDVKAGVTGLAPELLKTMRDKGTGIESITVLPVYKYQVK